MQTFIASHLTRSRQLAEEWGIHVSLLEGGGALSSLGRLSAFGKQCFYRPSWLSCPPKIAVLQRHKQSLLCRRTPWEKMIVVMVCDAFEESLKTHLKIMITCGLPCWVLPLLSVTVVTHKYNKCNPDRLERRHKSDQGQGRANTGLSLHTVPVGLDTSGGGNMTLKECFMGYQGCDFTSLYLILHGNH